jgi:cobalt transporter subunit CbtB
MTTSAPAIAATSLSLSQRLAAGLLILALGFALVGGIGFAGEMAVHNGAHDTRHALGFPCH